MYNDDVSCRKVPKSKASKAIGKEIKHKPTLVSQKRQYAMGVPETLLLSRHSSLSGCKTFSEPVRRTE
jgi:hypothetical protein